MKKILSKMNISEIIAGSICVGLLVGFAMLVIWYITGYSIFATLSYVLPIIILGVTLCVLMGILLVCANKLKKKED